MSKSAPALILLALLGAGQIGCRACGGSHLDYASPVAGCECGPCEGGCRAGSVHAAPAVTTIAAPAAAVIREAPSPIPAAPVAQ